MIIFLEISHSTKKQDQADRKPVSVQIFPAVEERGSARTELTFMISEYGQGSSCDDALKPTRVRYKLCDRVELRTIST